MSELVHLFPLGIIVEECERLLLSILVPQLVKTSQCNTVSSARHDHNISRRRFLLTAGLLSICCGVINLRSFRRGKGEAALTVNHATGRRKTNRNEYASIHGHRPHPPLIASLLGATTCSLSFQVSFFSSSCCCCFFFSSSFSPLVTTRLPQVPQLVETLRVNKTGARC